MTKSELINALVPEGDIAHVISRLMDAFKELAPEVYYTSDLIAEADDILKSLECDEPAYVASSEVVGEHKGVRLMRVEHKEEEVILII